jgi:hypothetical protein
MNKISSTTDKDPQYKAWLYAPLQCIMNQYKKRLKGIVQKGTFK